ncbi:phage major capsid protein [Flagellatimonas centrodinii]|uniref:phage major capsid protein n=1 Tax=Flagellatimonas centrodinii TaxID=2806210 RepID=UPI001FEF7960|nr:phage major capsid protein [Flagellatimonas centrodinii]ULQ46947.1 phage major capsid protein [Flagellatimonas centrodinii]
MALPSAVFTEIVTTTRRERIKTWSDNMANNNALLSRLKKRGKMKTIDGGYEIVYPLEYAENATYQRYSGYDTLNIQASDVLTAAKYDWRQAAVNVTASGLELRQNNGKNAMLDLVKSRLNVAMKTMSNNMSQDIYSDGSAANQVGGLQLLVADNGGGVVGGINSATQTWWKNVVQDANAPLQGGGAITPSKSTIKSLMNALYIELVRGNDKPDLIVSSNDYFIFYEESLQDNQRYGDEQMASSGFVSLKYKTADVVFDGGSKGGGIPDAHMYFLNTDYLKFVSHRDANFTEVAEKTSVNQDAVVIPIIWQGNLCCSNRSLQGVLLDNGT